MKILGINDEQTTCDCCGKVDLKRTVVILDGENVGRFGTTCAMRKMGASRDVTAAAERREAGYHAVFTRTGVEVSRFGRGTKSEVRARFNRELVPASWRVMPVGCAK